MTHVETNRECLENAAGQPPEIEAQDKVVDGLLREYARTGSGPDSDFVEKTMTAVEKADTTWVMSRALKIQLAVAASIAIGLFGILPMCRLGSQNTTAIVEKEQQYQKIGVQKLAMHLAEKYPGAKALIMTEPRMGTAASRPNILVEGLKEGFAGKIMIVGQTSPEVPRNAAKAFIEGKPGVAGEEPGMESEMLPPLEYWYTAAVLDDILMPYLDRCDLIITTIGLPQDVEKSLIWNNPECPKFAIANGSIYELKDAIMHGIITAAITYNPKAEYDDKPVPADIEGAFDKRFLLITPENIQDIAANHGDIFR